MSEIKPVTTAPIDFPMHLSKELERLHELVRSQSLDGEPHKDISQWAREKIDNIHNCYFSAKTIKISDYLPKEMLSDEYLDDVTKQTIAEIEQSVKDSY